MKYMWTAGQDVSTYIGTRTLSLSAHGMHGFLVPTYNGTNGAGAGISSGVVWYSVQCNQINIPSPEIHLTTVFILAN